MTDTPAEETTICWNCNNVYPMKDDKCDGCCSTNANVCLESAKMEMGDASHIDHNWDMVDYSFDHEFGTEHCTGYECQRCGATRNY